MLREALRVAALVALLSCALLFGVRRTDEPSLVCHDSAGSDPAFRILVVGESWTCNGGLYPELTETVSQRLLGRRASSCSLCFPGRNSMHLYSELREKFPRGKLYEAIGGPPDKVIFMTGVNDEIQHVGEDAYVEYTKKMIEYFSDVADEELVSIPRVNELRYDPPNLFSRLKRAVLMCVYDNCQFIVNDKYRSALWRDHPELRMIEFDDFINRYFGHEACYQPDGVHLTSACLHRYGAFIGASTALDRQNRLHSKLGGAPAAH